MTQRYSTPWDQPGNVTTDQPMHYLCLTINIILRVDSFMIPGVSWDHKYRKFLVALSRVSGSGDFVNVLIPSQNIALLIRIS